MNRPIRIAVAGLLVIGALVAPSTSASQPDIAIRYRWTNGETLRYRMTLQNTTTLSGFPGGLGDMTVEQTQVQVLRAVVEDVAADGTATLQQRIESMKLDVKAPMGSMSYDSANPDASVVPIPAMTKMLAAMIDEPFTVVMAPTGAVKKIEGFTRLMQKVLENAPQTPGGTAALSALAGTLNDDALLNMMGQGFTQFPDRPLKIGESWSSQFSTTNPMIGALAMSISATLKAVEGTGADQVATLAILMTFKQSPGGSPAATPSGMSIQMGDSTGEGESRFDVAKGRMLRSTVRTTMPMTMSGPGPDGTPITMSTTVKGNMNMELVAQ